MTAGRRPLYARVLRLRRLRPGALLCFLFFECTIALGTLLALAELASWWVVIVLPLSVAAMVKFNDVIAASMPYPRVQPIPAARVAEHPILVSASVPVAVAAEPERTARQRFSDGDHDQVATRPQDVAGSAEEVPGRRGTVYGSPARAKPYRSPALGPDADELGETDRVGSAEQRARQSGSSRYE